MIWGRTLLRRLTFTYRGMSNKNAVPDSLSGELSRPKDLSQTPPPPLLPTQNSGPSGEIFTLPVAPKQKIWVNENKAAFNKS